MGWLATIPTGGGPLSVAVSPDGKTAVVGNDSDGTATVIDTGVNTVRGTVPGMDESAFRDEAEGAKENCPVSKALAGIPDVTLEASIAA